MGATYPPQPPRTSFPEDSRKERTLPLLGQRSSSSLRGSSCAALMLAVVGRTLTGIVVLSGICIATSSLLNIMSDATLELTPSVGIRSRLHQTLLKMANFQRFDPEDNVLPVQVGAESAVTQATRGFSRLMGDIPVFACPSKRILGNRGSSGGWVCMEAFERGLRQEFARWGSAGVVTFASGCDVALESQLNRTRGIRSTVFDTGLMFGTVPEAGPVHMVKARLVGSSKKEEKKAKYPSDRWITFPEAISEALVEFADIIRLDCEGCEADLAADLAPQGFNRTRPLAGHMLIQVHNAHAKRRLPKLQAVFRTLSKMGFCLFSAEPNVKYGKHYDVSLVHERLVLPDTRQTAKV